MKYLNYINYLYLNGYLDVLPKNRMSEYITTSFFDFIKKILNIAIDNFKISIKKAPSKRNLNKDWLIYQSRNNYDTLKNLKNDSNEFVKIFDDLNFKYIWFYKTFYAIPLFFNLLFSKRLNVFSLFYASLGYYEEALRILRNHVPKRLFFANDHNPIQRAFLKAATNLGIETFYFQHAFVTKFFPPLDFGVSFLDGKASYDVYKKIGNIKGRVELLGNIKYLKIHEIELNKVKKTAIGIAINQNDNLDDIAHLVHYINMNLKKFEIILRKHPRDHREIELRGKYILSDSNSENVINYLNNISSIISGNSSILLEAASMNVQPIYYYPVNDNKFYDYYGFLKHGLVDELNDIENLKSIINNGLELDYRTRTNYYIEKLDEISIKNLLSKYNISSY